MSLYSVSVQCPGASAGSPVAMLRNPNASSLVRARIREVKAFCNAATAASIGLVRATGLGSPSVYVLGQSLDDADPQLATCLVDSAWSAAPTIAGSPIYFEQAVLQAAQGAGIIWPYDREPIKVSGGGGLVLWNFGVSPTPAMTVGFTWEE